MGKTREEIKSNMRLSGRYPYTYACDMLRQCGLADSRSEAAQLYNSYEEAVEIAELYISQAALDRLRDETLKSIKEELNELYS